MEGHMFHGTRKMPEREGWAHACARRREGQAGTYQDGGWLQEVEAAEKKIGAKIERRENNKRK